MSKLRAMVGLMIKQGYSEEEIQNVITRYREEYPEEQVVDQPVPEYSSSEFASSAISDIEKEKEQDDTPKINVPKRPGLDIKGSDIKKDKQTPDTYLDRLADETREISDEETEAINNSYNNAKEYINNVRSAIPELANATDDEVRAFIEQHNKNKSDVATQRSFQNIQKTPGSAFQAPVLQGQAAELNEKNERIESLLKEKGLSSKDEDAQQHETLRLTHIQDKALQRYFEENPNEKIAYDSIVGDEQNTGEELQAQWKSDVINSEKFKEVEQRVAAEINGDEEKTKELNDFIEKQFKAGKEKSAFEDRIAKYQQEKFGTKYLQESKEERSLSDAAVRRADKKKAENQDLLQKFDIVNEDLNKIDKELKDLVKYFEDTDIEKIIDDAKNKKYNTQEEIDKAQEDLNNIISEYRNKGARYSFLRDEGNRYIDLSKSLFSKIQKGSLEEQELVTIAKEIGRNRGVVTTWFANLGNATIDLIQGIGDAADMVFQVPDEIISQIDDPVLEGYMRTVYKNSSPLGWVFADDETTKKVGGRVITTNESNWTKFGDSLDRWQEENITNKVRRPVSFEDIDSFGSAVEWGANLFAQQIPNLVLMATTGGASLYVMGASATGNKYRQLQDEKEEYLRSGGLYGNNLSFGTMFANATFSGAAEALSEKVTLGAVGKTAQALTKKAGKDAVKLGYDTYLRKNIFTFNNLKSSGLEFLEEGFSESLASMSSNFADIMSGNKEADIFDGVTESFISGGLISSGLQGLRLAPRLTAPFRTKDNNQRIGEIGNRMNKISESIASLAGQDGSGVTVRRARLEREQAELLDEASTLIEQDIKRVNLLSDSEKANLIKIEKANYQARLQAENVMADENLTPEQKTEEIEALQKQVDKRNSEKQTIIDKYPPNVVDENYKQEMEMMKAYEKEVAEQGGVPFVVREVKDSKEMAEDVSQSKFDMSVDAVENVGMEADGLKMAAENVINDPNSTPEEIAEAKETVKNMESTEGDVMNALNLIQGSAANYGSMKPVFNKDGSLNRLEMVINKEEALTDGMFNTASHEFVHVSFHNTLKQDPAARKKLGLAVIDILTDPSVHMSQESAALFDKRVHSYKVNQQGEEALAIAMEMYRKGQIQFNDSFFTKIKGVYRRFAQNYFNREIKLDTVEDIKNFMRDYDVSIKNNKPNKAIAKMIVQGAKGSMFKDAKAPPQSEINFSKNVKQVLKEDPLVKKDFDKFVQDEGGNKKYKTKDEFQESNDQWNAFTFITSTPRLDGLIASGINLDPGPMRDFIQKVKEKLGERLLSNFDPSVNESLFGWLTGVSGGAGKSIIFRAKGDVLAEMQKATPEEGITSLDKTYDDYGDLSETLQSESDAYMERLENMDLSPGAKQAIEEIVTGLVVDNVLEVSDQGKRRIKEVVSNYKGNFDGAFYKDFKKLISEVAKIEKDGKIKRPTKEGDVTPLGPLYGVLEVIAGEFGIEPARILANQDLDDTMRQQAQELILSRSLNEDGTFNPALFDLLPEGEDRTGKATGIAQGALGKFYDKGSRIAMGGKDQSGTGVGKARQTKRTEVDPIDFLDTFGINEDGSFRPGTSADGAIRQLVLNLAALSANQNARLEGLEMGTLSEKLAAKLSDGKSEISFSQKIQADPVDFILDQVIASYGPDGISIERANKIYEDAYGNELSKKQKTEEAKELKRSVDLFVEAKGVSAPGIKLFVLDRIDLLRQEQSLKKSLGVTGNVGDVYIEKDKDGNATGVNNLRKIASNVGNLLVGNKISQVEAGRMVMSDSTKLAFYNSGRIADGRFVADPPGSLNVIENPTTDGTPMLDPETGEKKSNRKHVVETVEDYLALVNNTDGENIVKFIKEGDPDNGKWIRKSKQKGFNYDIWNPQKNNWEPVKTTQLKEKTEAAVKDRDGVTREQQSQEARLISKIILDSAWQKVEAGTMSNKEFAALITTLGSSMNSALRKAAPVRSIVKGVQKIIAWANKNGIAIKDVLRFEHRVPKAEINDRIVKSYKEKGTLDIDTVFKDYEVVIIPAPWDDAMTAVGMKSKVLSIGDRLFNPATLLELANTKDPRYVNKDGTLNEIFLQPLESIVDNNNIEEVSTDAIKRVKHHIETQASERNDGYLYPELNERRAEIMESKKVSPRGASVFDFDETLIVKGENFVIATDPETGNEIKISSEQWPIQGPQLMKDGYEFNFDDFVNVRGGVEGPLMQKLRNRIEKFGPENTFVLTARPQASAIAIHEWLKSKGINIPLENITGLANSTGEAKAVWIAKKFGEGYNDIYFVDDALPNVSAVKDVMEQLDMKGKSEQVREDQKDLDQEFNQIIEDTRGVQKEKTFSKAKARQRGKGKGKWKFFLPPSAEDLKGLIYPFLGKGKKGEAHMKFFNDHIITPYAKAVRAVNALKQSVGLDLKALKKSNKKITKSLKDKAAGTDFTVEQAIMIYNYNKAGINLPGLSQADKNAIVKLVEGDAALKMYADQYGSIVETGGGLTTPDDIGWLSETLASNLNEATNRARQNLMQQFEDNWNTIFSEKNLNKIESEYGLDHRLALEDMFYRMKHGTNRRDGSSHMNKFMNWVHGSIGTTMFFNARSAILQTLSTVNFINWSDNNPIKAGIAFANQKQFWSDFLMLFNSPFLKQRRAGLSYDVNANELVAAVKGSRNPIKTAIGLLLQKGFLPTQIADSFAIAFGGATFIRNRINKYVKEGMSRAEAEAQAFIEFQEIAEETQQSARPDKISQIQASPLGKVIFAFQNTPMQYNRLMKRAAQDFINGRGDAKTHISKILYYGAIQNAIFYSLQQALFAVTFGDDEEEDEKQQAKNEKKYARVANGMADTILRGSGIYGAVFATAKNTVLKFFEEDAKGRNADHAYTVIEATNLGVPIGIKIRKLYGGFQSWEFNKDVIKHMPKTHIDNPLYDAAFAAIEATTNVPLSRIHGKIRNVREAMNSDHRKLERIAMLLGWSTWSFDIQPQALLDAKKEVKELKKEAAKERREQKKIEREKIREEENKAVIEKNIEDQKKQKEEGNKEVQCAAVSKSGKRCSNTALPGQNFCTVHQKVEKREDGKQIQCKKIKSDGNRCKMKTTNKSGLCYYHD